MHEQSAFIAPKRGLDLITDRTIYDGRPSDPTGRCEKELEVYDFLDRIGLPFQRLDHEAIFTMEECRERGEILGIHICKNLFLTNATRSRFILLLMPADKRFRTSVFSKLAGSSRLSFAPESDMQRLLQTTPGSASVMGLIFDRNREVELYIDSDVLEREYLGCHPCINTSTIKLKTADLLSVYLPAVRHKYCAVRLPAETESAQ